MKFQPIKSPTRNISMTFGELCPQVAKALFYSW